MLKSTIYLEGRQMIGRIKVYLSTKGLQIKVYFVVCSTLQVAHAEMSLN
jgi:hypothetical protein